MSFPSWSGEVFEAYQPILDASLGLNIISIGCDFIIIFGYLFLYFSKPELVNRVSLRIIFTLAIIDIWSNSNEIFWYSETENDAVCSVFAWGTVFVTHFYYTLNCSIAINILILTLLKKPFQPKRERYYYFFAFVMGTLATIVFLILGELVSKGSRKCYLSSTGDISIRVMYFLTDGLWFVSSLFINLCIAIITYSTYNRPGVVKIGTEQTSQVPVDRIILHLPQIRRLVLQVALFPLIPLVTQTFMLLYTLTTKLTERTSYVLESIAFITSSLNGILYLTFILFDPTIRYAVYELFRPSSDCVLSLKLPSTLSHTPSNTEFRHLTRGF